MMRIVFLGTPEFAVPSLDILVQHGYPIPAVVTAPDKPGGRLGVQQSAVKRYALEHDLPVLQPPKLKDPAFLDALKDLGADLQIVVAFRMLPEAVWNMPPRGTMNLHASLLPRYRGAAPINWAIINGEKETGLTTFLLKHEIDTGDILFQERVHIGENETAGELHDRMMTLGASLVLRSVQALETGAARPLPQVAGEVTHAPKIFTDTCRIEAGRTVREIHNFIRGLSPYPGAWMDFDGRMLKILRAVPDERTPLQGGPGELFSDGKHYLMLRVANGYLAIEELQMEGKKRMSARDFLNGFKHPWASLQTLT
ncbi:MAG: methionyl-tRNA formyltransferase [Saprospiraceae bacterium]|nr:methionyl-tRNA formyltransferase [Saprospiraceae bacterium]